jgi:hypothetical protein
MVANALSRKERVKPLRVRSMRIDVRVDLMDQLKQAQALAMEKNAETEARPVNLQREVMG